ncbi:MAG TPA: MopE-related protein, partial [Kofleriaceae bacterium]
MRTLVVWIVCWMGLGCGSSAHDAPDAPGAGCAQADLGLLCSVGTGACRAEGVTVCRADGGGTTCTAHAGTPTVERCNGVDDDCDGQVDEGFAVGTACSTGQGACARMGSIVCDLASGQAVCDAQPGTGTAELCNGIDDNCDGQVDEGFGLGTPCEIGTGACLRAGVLACDSDGAARCTAVAGAPSAELCNGIDDDCDGIVDDVAGLGDACTANAPGACAAGHLVCGAGQLICAPGTGEPETCNGIDDNCNGQVDEGFGVGAACSVGVGACRREGLTVCDGLTATRCSATAGSPSAERCNGVDDDCNGT